MLRNLLAASAMALCFASPALAQDPAQPPAQQAPVGPPRQEWCGISFLEPERAVYVSLPNFTLLDATPPLVAPADQPRIDAVICERTSLIIGPHDYRVLTDLHVPLFIRNGDRTAVLERQNGQMHVRFTSGAPTAEETQAMSAALDRAQDDFQRLQAGGAQ